MVITALYFIPIVVFSALTGIGLANGEESGEVVALAGAILMFICSMLLLQSGIGLLVTAGVFVIYMTTSAVIYHIYLALFL